MLVLAVTGAAYAVPSPAAPLLPAPSGWRGYSDAVRGFSLSYPAGWRVVPDSVNGARPGLGGVILTTALANRPAGYTGSTLVLVALEATDLPLDRTLVQNLGVRFGHSYMNLVRTETLPGGLEVADAAHDQGHLFLVRLGARLYSITLPWTNAPDRAGEVLSILTTLGLQANGTGVVADGLSAFIASSPAIHQERPAASSSPTSTPPTMVFPWDASLTIQYTGGPHGSPWDICGQYPWSGYEGIDFGMYLQQVLAVADGSILAFGYDPIAGNYVIVDHGNGWTTHYWHLNSIDNSLVVGMQVTQGRLLGISGNTGSGAGGAYHLHLSLHLDGGAYSWNGTAINGWLVRSDYVSTNTSLGYNYQGTMTQGSESQWTINECGGQGLENHGSTSTAYASVGTYGTLLSSWNHINTGGSIPTATPTQTPTPTATFTPTPCPTPTQTPTPLPPPAHGSISRYLPLMSYNTQPPPGCG